MSISQIRAYSYKPGAYPNYQIFTTNAGCQQAPSMIWQFPLYLQYCRYEFYGSPPYYNLVFNVPRFVHVVTLVGDAFNDYI